MPPFIMRSCRALQSPVRIVTQKFIRNGIPETEPAFDFHTRPVDGATAAWRGQHNLPVKQCDYMPGRDRADDKGEIVPRDTAGRLVVFPEVCGNACSGRVNDGVVRIGDGFRVELVEAHNDVFGCRQFALGVANKPEWGLVRCLSKPQAARGLPRTLSLWSIACYEPLAVRRTRSGVEGGCRIDSACRAIAVAEVVAVAGLLCEIQSTILRNFGVADITFKGLNNVRDSTFSVGTGRAFQVRSH
jgi:hypothetical protein